MNTPEKGPFDVVFDASNAEAHAEHWASLAGTGATLIDLTPAPIDTMVVPTVNGTQARSLRHINLVSCGGQASIPVLHAIARHCAPAYVEVVCTGASAGTGRATRLNLDQYIATTSAAVRAFTGAPEVKVMVNLSPAQPEPPFRVADALRSLPAPESGEAAPMPAPYSRANHALVWVTADRHQSKANALSPGVAAAQPHGCGSSRPCRCPRTARRRPCRAP